MTKPLGGRLVYRLVTGERAKECEKKARLLPKVSLTPFEVWLWPIPFGRRGQIG